MDYKRLGERIREERLRLNLTQAQLAEAVDISDTYMGAIERGERSLTLDTLVRLVNRLGVTVDYLLADSVSDSDTNIMEQFKQIIDQQPLERKQMAINVLRTIFAYFGGEGAFLTKSISSTSRRTARLTSSSTDTEYSAESVCSLSYNIGSLSSIFNFSICANYTSISMRFPCQFCN